MFEAKKGDNNNNELPALIGNEEYVILAEKISEMKLDEAIQSIEFWIKKHSLTSKPQFIFNILLQEIKSCIEMHEQDLCQCQAEVRDGAKGNRYDDEGEYNFELDFEDYAVSEVAVVNILEHLESLNKIKKALTAIIESFKKDEVDKGLRMAPGRGPL